MFSDLAEMKRKHAKDIEKLTNKTNSKIKSIEEEFNLRFQQNTEVTTNYELL